MAVPSIELKDSNGAEILGTVTAAPAANTVGARLKTIADNTSGLGALATAAELAKVPKSDSNVTWNATALGDINAQVDTALNTIVPASPTAGSLNDILSKAAPGNTFNKATDSLEAIRDAMALDGTVAKDATVAKTTELLSAGTNDFNATTKASIQTAAAAALAAVAYKRQAGVTQVFTKQITSAANAGAVTVATITAAACMIKSLVVRSNGATTADLTNISVKGGAGTVVTFIDTVTGVRANIAAADQQVSWTGAATFAATKTIVITLTGTGATAVDLQVDVEFVAIADTGYLA